jgi:integrase
MSCQAVRVTSEGPARITKTTVDAAWRRRGTGHRLIVRDLQCRGLALIVNSTGMAWMYAYRPRGIDPRTQRRWPNRTVTIGNPATHSPEDARFAANRLKGQAQAGTDPVAEKKAKARIEQWKRGSTLGPLIDEYATALPKRPKMRGSGLPSADYVADELAQVRTAISAMDAEDLPPADLSSDDVRTLLGKVTGATARARFGALSRFLDWCLDERHVQANPCLQIARARRPKAPAARSDYLVPADLARLWRAAEELPEAVWRDLAQFLIAVPCRRGEAAILEWSHVDLEMAEWRQTDRVTKNGEPHKLFLLPVALEILRRRHGATSGKGLIFPAPKSGRAIDTFSDIKAKITAASGLSGWRWHDLRRSFATALGEAGIPEAVADAVLNHRQAATRGGVLGVYQRASRWPEQVKAMRHWGSVLAGALEGQRDDAVVIPLIRGQ